jgi:hypothetical protein
MLVFPHHADLIDRKDTLFVIRASRSQFSLLELSVMQQDRWTVHILKSPQYFEWRTRFGLQLSAWAIMAPIILVAVCPFLGGENLLVFRLFAKKKIICKNARIRLLDLS